MRIIKMIIKGWLIGRNARGAFLSSLAPLECALKRIGHASHVRTIRRSSKQTKMNPWALNFGRMVALNALGKKKLHWRDYLGSLRSLKVRFLETLKENVLQLDFIFLGRTDYSELLLEFIQKLNRKNAFT